MPADQAYFKQRAEAELVLARRANYPGAIKAHYTLAGHYLNRAYGGAPGPLGSICQNEEADHGGR